QSAKADESPTFPIKVCESVGAVRIGDVNLDDHKIRAVVESEWLYVLVFDDGTVIRREICGQRGESEWRKERVLNRTPVRIGRFGQCGKNELYFEGTIARGDHRTPLAAEIVDCCAGSG